MTFDWSAPGVPRTTASFDSDCPGCGSRILEGDEIGKVDDEWVCAECADEEDDRNELRRSGSS